MATVFGVTREKALELEANQIVSGRIDPISGKLLLTKGDGTTIEAGQGSEDTQIIGGYVDSRGHLMLQALRGPEIDAGLVRPGVSLVEWHTTSKTLLLSDYPNAVSFKFELWGAGGGGGSTPSSHSSPGGGGGGGGGGYYSFELKPEDFGSGIAITIGAGGVGSTTDAAGGSGGSTMVYPIDSTERYVAGGGGGGGPLVSVVNPQSTGGGGGGLAIPDDALIDNTLFGGPNGMSGATVGFGGLGWGGGTMFDIVTAATVEVILSGQGSYYRGGNGGGPMTTPGKANGGSSHKSGGGGGGSRYSESTPDRGVGGSSFDGGAGGSNGGVSLTGKSYHAGDGGAGGVTTGTGGPGYDGEFPAGGGGGGFRASGSDVYSGGNGAPGVVRLTVSYV